MNKSTNKNDKKENKNKKNKKNEKLTEGLQHSKESRGARRSLSPYGPVCTALPTGRKRHEHHYRALCPPPL